MEALQQREFVALQLVSFLEKKSTFLFDSPLQHPPGLDKHRKLQGILLRQENVQGREAACCRAGSGSATARVPVPYRLRCLNPCLSFEGKGDKRETNLVLPEAVEKPSE